MNKFIILYGLPGSGKSTFAEKFRKEKRDSDVRVIDCDKLMRRTDLPFEKNLNRSIYWSDYTRINKNDYYTVFDGLFTQNSDIIKIVNIVKENIDAKFEVWVCWWEENRDACLWNDEGRRNIASRESIKNLPFEAPDVKAIEAETGITVSLRRNIVVRKSEVKHFADANGIYVDENDYFYSSSWCTGGFSKNCWGGSMEHSSEEPVYFEEFDNVILKLAPNLNFMIYNKIKSKCVDVYDYNEGDYYGGSTNYSKYRCKMSTLLDELEPYIENEE